MYGRYGADQFSVFLLVLYTAFALVSFFIVNTVVRIVLYVIGAAIIVYWFFRMFSRKISARQAENAAFMKIWLPTSAFFVRQYNRIRYIKKYRYRKCPGCKNFLRLPYKKGAHTVRCPKCAKNFDVRL